jgi:hypothetical protein
MSGMFWTDERVAQMKALHDAGRSYRQIAAELGCSRNAVSGKADRLNLPPRGPSRPRVKRQAPAIDLAAALAVAAPSVAPEPQPRVLSQPEPKQEALGTVSFAELREHHCRWILNDDTSNPVFCGQQKSGRSYCEAHRLLAYVRAG